jgi:hypothetical protein
MSLIGNSERPKDTYETPGVHRYNFKSDYEDLARAFAANFLAPSRKRSSKIVPAAELDAFISSQFCGYSFVFATQEFDPFG